MSRSIFGWDLPPGCRYSDIDPPEAPCEICGEFVDNCICPECPICGSVGDPLCYNKHGLVRTVEQANSLLKHENEWAKENELEAKYWEEQSKKEEETL